MEAASLPAAHGHDDHHHGPPPANRSSRPASTAASIARCGPFSATRRPNHTSGPPPGPGVQRSRSMPLWTTPTFPTDGRHARAVCSLTATNVTIKAITAKTPQEAAKVYPGNYWLSMMAPPPKNLFPGTGPQGNGVSVRMASQELWINSLKRTFHPVCRRKRPATPRSA